MTSPFVGGFIGVEFNDDASSLIKRQQGCVKCDDKSPECPVCADDEECNISVIMDCKTCPSAYCMKDPSKINQGTTTTSNTPNSGAIAGGVIAGVVAIAVATYLVWRFCVKNKRKDYEDQWRDEELSKEANDDFASRRSKRASTHTVHSIASTVLTRASNIIQIAYIPGVTNRAQPTSPTVLVPPVPPIPLAHADNGKDSSYEDQHFFVPGDLRDSTYSGFSTYTDGTAYGRTSYAPRSSVASTIYGKNAVVSPLPAQKGNFLKPSLVSVKSRAPSSDGSENMPPVPAVDYEKYDKPPPSPAFSIGATFFKNASASTATAVRPQVVRVGSGGPKQIDVKSKASSTASHESADGLGPLIEVEDTRKERDSRAVTIINDTPTEDQGPFSDPPKTPTTPKSVRSGRHNRNSSLGDILTETSRRAAENKSANRDQSPFGDEHAVKDN